MKLLFCKFNWNVNGQGGKKLIKMFLFSHFLLDKSTSIINSRVQLDHDWSANYLFQKIIGILSTAHSEFLMYLKQ